MSGIRVMGVLTVSLVAACSGPTIATGQTPTPPPATVAAATTAPVESTTTLPEPPTSVAVADLAEGSGCTPETPDALPDGTWFGFAVAATGSALTFDLACWFSGDAATIAAAEDGEESPPPNDYHIRNENPAVRVLEVEPDIAVDVMAVDGDPATYGPMGWLDFADRLDDGPMAVWIEVSGSRVVGLEQQYRP